MISAKAFYLFLGLACAQTVFALDVRHNDTRQNNFYMDALQWVLDKSGQEYELISTEHPLTSQQRKFYLLENREIDVVYAGTSPELEGNYRAIYFPVMRGLSGVRLFIINKAYRHDYGAVSGLADLKKFIGIQGIGWSDTAVLESAGLPQESRLYDDIFGLLDSGARYYFPRGVTEVFTELNAHSNTLANLQVEERLLLRYKTAIYFFIHPDNRVLHEALNRGFEKGYEDGSYQAFFYSHPLIEESLRMANTPNRAPIHIDNPHVTQATDSVPAAFWH